MLYYISNLNASIRIVSVNKLIYIIKKKYPNFREKLFFGLIRYDL